MNQPVGRTTHWAIHGVAVNWSGGGAEGAKLDLAANARLAANNGLILVWRVESKGEGLR